MRLTDFDFELPAELIARYPLSERSASRLLCLQRQTGAISHHQFSELPQLLAANDLLVFNNTRVLHARLFGQKATGGKVEVLIERILSEREALVQMNASKPPRIGTTVFFTSDISATVLSRQAEWYQLRFHAPYPIAAILQQIGQLPLPPYLQRSAERLDEERYQTVFASREGAVAAPTAGLHFDDVLLAQLAAKEVQRAFVTLHVGAGTFQPVRTTNIREHQLHAEYCEIPTTVCAQVNRCQAQDGRVVAVGTTAVRSLETAAQQGEIAPYYGDTTMFIYPGYSFRVVDALITNFHLPKSTLLMLVCAFGGYEAVMTAYRRAVAAGYRFFSYGDAMLVV